MGRDGLELDPPPGDNVRPMITRNPGSEAMPAMLDQPAGQGAAERRKPAMVPDWQREMAAAVSGVEELLSWSS